MRGGRTGVALVPLKADAAAEPPAPRYSLAASADPAFAWMRDYYDESWGADRAGPERDARERLAREAAAVEAVIYVQSHRTAITLGAARGAAARR